MSVLRSRQALLTRPLGRLREAGWRILQTMIAAVASWYVALLVLPEQVPFFAPIAAIIVLSGSYGQRGGRTWQVIVGVGFGIVLAELLLSTIGTGLLQLALLLVLAMGAAVLVKGGPLLINQAAISALLLTVLEPADSSFSPDRLLEALLGGGMALLVNSLLFPPNPLRLADRPLKELVRDLAEALDRIAAALASGDRDDAAAALQCARGVDDRVDALEEALDVGRETTRLAPPRRAARGPLNLYEREARQLDFAVRNTRVLGRDVVRFVRRAEMADAELAEAVRVLADVARSLDQGNGRSASTRELALEAVRRAEAVLARRNDLATSAIVSQIRSTAADLLRAAEPKDGPPDASYLAPTEDLLGGASGAPPPPSSS